MIDVSEIGAQIEEALNDSDDTELMSVINSFTPEQWQAVAKALQNTKTEGSDER